MKVKHDTAVELGGLGVIQGNTHLLLFMQISAHQHFGHSNCCVSAFCDFQSLQIRFLVQSLQRTSAL